MHRLLVLAALAISGCGGGGGDGGGTGTGPAATPTTVRVRPAPLSIDLFAAPRQLTATVIDQRGNPMPGEAVTWSASNPAVLEVNSATGVVRPLAVGRADVIARAGSAEGTSRVTVTNAAAGTYSLATLDGSALPRALGEPRDCGTPTIYCRSVEYVTAGTLTLRPDKTASLVEEHRTETTTHGGTSSATTTPVLAGTYTIANGTLTLTPNSAGTPPLTGTVAARQITLAVVHDGDTYSYVFRR